MHTCPNLHDFQPQIDSRCQQHVDPFSDFPPELCEQLRSVDPSQPTNFGPGSQKKQLLLAMRYAAGLPLWIDGDTNWTPEPQSDPPAADADAIEDDPDDFNLPD